MSRFSPPIPSTSGSSGAAAASSPAISISSPPRMRSRIATASATTASSSTNNLRVFTGDSSPSSHPGSPPKFIRTKSDSAGLGGFADGQISSSPSSGNGSPSQKRGRSSSILSIHEIKENADDDLDKSAFANLNAEWVNYKGAWLIHVVLIAIGKVLVDSIPGIEQDTSWTIVLQSYLLATYVMFHFVEGVPFESNSGVYDRLTLWEQIDGGAQYTPAKKMLTSLPIILFLLSTHYTRYDHHPALFSLNLISLVVLALIPKLPQLHRQRVTFGGPSHTTRSENGTGANTPVETAMSRAQLPSLPE
ncbi:MAG: hypothetical protein CYPHOPRED_001278 [Cyphobasidiales sp. Tagirdzhanova-0007]|nr:MAG: hypothetical protein CYPHOPRED_001278 [Cyphobasidiales sp. Tagirdzhanova-0007]